MREVLMIIPPPNVNEPNQAAGKGTRVHGTSRTTGSMLIGNDILDRQLAELLAERSPSQFNDNIPSGQHWSRLIDRACDIGVAGTLEERLHALRASLPIHAIQRLSRERERIAAQNRHCLRWALTLIESFEASGICYVLLKGAALLGTIYQSIDMRPMTDIDLLIRAEDANRADRAIEKLGGHAGVDLVRPDFYPRFHYEREYLLGRPSIKIDLHVRPFRPTLFAMHTPVSAFLSEFDTTHLLDREVRIPNRSMMLLHLAVHAACHGGRHLRWLYDMFAWHSAYRTQIDPQDVARSAHAYRLTEPFRFALMQVDACFTCPQLIAPFLDALPAARDPIAKVTLSQASRALERPVWDAAINALGVPGWRGKLAYFAAVGLPQDAHLREHYARTHRGWKLAAHATRLAKKFTSRAAPNAR